MTHLLFHLSRRHLGACGPGARFLAPVGAVARRARHWFSGHLPAIEFISQAEEDRRLEELQNRR